MLKKEAKKQYQREYMKRKRSNSAGLTGDGSNTEGLTSGTGLTKSQGLSHVPEFAHILPQERIDLVRGALDHRARHGVFDDSIDRWERATRYYKWELAGRPVAGVYTMSKIDALFLAGYVLVGAAFFCGIVALLLY